MLKYTIDKLEDVPEPLRSEYEPRDGKLHLAVDGHPDTARVAEFRERNIALHKTLSAFDGLDPVAARAALAKAASGDPDEVTGLKLKLAEAESAAAGATQKHDALVVKQAVSAAFLAAGGQPEAVDFIVGKAPFTLVDGELKPNDAAVPTLEDWLKDQVGGPLAWTFKPSSGGGARGATQSALRLSGHSSRVERLVNPTPQELGARAKDIAAGRVKVDITT